ncbi:Flagellar hook-basal body complex protein FliE [Pseudoalteromonas sp. CIP111854]|uniref:Flagellar hook-basal body complex protein FliE n=1 Tax=Pseudoalteromonas holothuriae TaxID=2963714 RepID=A0A9W4VTD8_9GAMM|nr:flagellar hook-basal body complex protein FliE [Pseudoalteromonas sp. CIP111854]CAH9061694.1 Flagellar hook-basal body complex protein FliE [Pseudoalteromonas sp. CIP111854]
MEVLAIGSTELVKTSDVAELVSTQPQSVFMDTMLAQVAQLNGNLVEANSIVERVAMGESIPSHEIMIAMEKARLELNMAVQVRNKLLDVYQEITKMQI